MEVAGFFDLGAGVFGLVGSADLVAADDDAGAIWPRNIERYFPMAGETSLLRGLLLLWGDVFWTGILGAESWQDLVGVAAGVFASFLVGQGIGEE